MLGKYSVLPMPSGAGRTDRIVSYVDPADLERFLEVVRSRLAVRFDITADILTHLAAYDIDNDRLLHRYEDEWITTASVAEMVRYIRAWRLLSSTTLVCQQTASPHAGALA